MWHTNLRKNHTILVYNVFKPLKIYISIRFLNTTHLEICNMTTRSVQNIIRGYWVNGIGCLCRVIANRDKTR